MEKILRVHNVNDYTRYIGAPELHPLVSVIHYDELEHCCHSLNSYDVYALFIGDEELEDLSYGTTAVRPAPPRCPDAPHPAVASDALSVGYS
jgi:hypothetical protein